MELVRRFGRNVLRRRLQLPLPQDDITGKTGIARDHLSNIERGKANPSLRISGKIAEALEVELAVLITEISDEDEG